MAAFLDLCEGRRYPLFQRICSLIIEGKKSAKDYAMAGPPPNLDSNVKRIECTIVTMMLGAKMLHLMMEH